MDIEIGQLVKFKHFDHLYDKKFSISQATIRGMGIEAILEEIKKCDLVCSNCHRLRTKSRRKTPC